MLYIASALTPTPILDSRLVPSFTSPGSSSLVIAKPDRIEVWDTEPTGLVHKAELALWGNVVGIDAVYQNAQPHILVLLAPPNAHLLLVTYTSTPSPGLIITASLPLTPPTPSLRQAEFYTSVIAQGNVALVSLWVGVLSCIEIDVEKDKDKKRRASEVRPDTSAKPLIFRDNFNINIREHNLLHLSFLPGKTSEPVLTFLWLSSSLQIQLQTRKLSLSAHSFVDTSSPLDVVSPEGDKIKDTTDFASVVFSCPAARRVLPIPDGSDGKYVLVIGDEYSVLYAISNTQSPRISRSSFSSVATSPIARATRRSPQNEMTGGSGKKRKSSVSKEDKWEIKPVFRVRQGLGTVLAATVIASHATGATVMLGDECGRLTAIGWEFGLDEDEPRVDVSRASMGTASPPSSLTYLDNAHLFLSSPCGDSLLLRLGLPVPKPIIRINRAARARAPGSGWQPSPEDDPGDWLVRVVEDVEGRASVRERWMNLAPVKDFVVVKDEGGGMSHLIVASGASNTNSLRVIRSGVGMEEVVSVEGVEGVTGMWTLNTLLMVSTASNSALVSFGPEIAVVQTSDTLTSQRTIAAGSVLESFVQVTPTAVTLWSDAQTSVTTWQGDGEIVAAQVAEDLVVVAKRGGDIAVLKVKDNSFEHLGSLATSEVAAVSILSAPNLPCPVIAVGTWSNEITLYSLGHDQPITTIPEQFFSASLVLRGSASGIQLLAGLSDGTMVAYDLTHAGVVTGRKPSSLGTRPLTISAVTSHEGDEKIVAVGISERMSVIFESRDRIDFSSVSIKDITAATTITTPEMGDCLVLATSKGLSVTKVNSLKKLSVQTLDLQDRSAGKLVSLDEQKLLGVGSTVRKMDEETEDIIQSGFVELRDPTTLKLLAELPLQTREEVTSMSEVLLLAKRYIAVGTAIFPNDEEADNYTLSGTALSAKEGRLLLIEPILDKSDKWTLSTAVNMVLGGAVYDSKVIHGFLAVAAGSKVSIHRLDLYPTTLTEISHFSSLFIAQHLHIAPSTKLHAEERLVVGDGMRSIFVLDVDEGNGVIHGDQRDMGTHQVLGMEGIRDGGEGVVVADGYSNVLTFRLNERIESAASFGLHEDIARFRPGSFVPPSTAADVIRPDLLFATTDGRLGVIGELTAGATRTFDDLQRNMDKFHKGPGGIAWKGWRRGGTELVKRDTAGFIDGDFVQRFLDTDLLPSSEASKILTGSTAPERVSKISSDGTKEIADRGDVVRLLEAVAGLH